jgi:hypothetical protein
MATDATDGGKEALDLRAQRPPKAYFLTRRGQWVVGVFMCLLCLWFSFCLCCCVPLCFVSFCFSFCLHRKHERMFEVLDVFVVLFLVLCLIVFCLHQTGLGVSVIGVMFLFVVVSAKQWVRGQGLQYHIRSFRCARLCSPCILP